MSVRPASQSSNEKKLSIVANKYYISLLVIAVITAHPKLHHLLLSTQQPSSWRAELQQVVRTRLARDTVLVDRRVEVVVVRYQFVDRNIPHYY